MKRSGFIVASIVIVALLVGTAIGYYYTPLSQKPSKLDQVRFAFSWIQYGAYAPYYAALDKGYYVENGIAVQMDRGFGSPDNIKRLMSGDLQFASVDATSLAIAKAREPGLTVKSVAIYMRDLPLTFIYVKNRPSSTGKIINSIKDLEGAKYGGIPGGVDTVSYAPFLKSQGVTAGEFVSMDATAKISALIGGRVDVTPTLLTTLPEYLKAAKERGVEVGYVYAPDLGLVLLSKTIATTEQMIREKPDLVKRFVEASVKGWKFAISNPDETVTIFKKYIPMADEAITKEELMITIKSVLPAYENARLAGKNWGYNDKERWEQTIKVVVETMNLPMTPKAEDLYSNQAIPDIKY